MSQHKHLYNRAAWRHLRLTQLDAEPFCRMCSTLGRLVVANVVDHRVPHRGNEVLFFDPENLQSLCKSCHDGHKQAQEHSADGILRGAGHDGLPLDLSHPFYRAAKAQIGALSASGVQTSAVVPAPSSAPARPDAMPARGAGGASEARGGGKSCRPRGPKTAHVPSFATCQNSQGGG